MAEAGGSSRQYTPMTTEGAGNRQPVPEALQLHGSDHPGMILVSTLLTKHNYLTWSYAVKRAFRAKLKLGFIDGTYVKPHITDPLFEYWVRVDSMVTTWILNCISKEIVGSFMYAKSARTLWVEKQREVHMDGAEAMDNAAMQVRGGGRHEFVPRPGQRKIHTDKRDWYKDLIEKKKKEGGAVRGYNVQMEDQQHQHKTHTQETLMQELIRLMKPEGHQMQLQEDPLQANFAQLDNFAGKNCALDLVTKRIIAIGKLFQNLYVLDKSSFSPSTIASVTAAHNKSCINSVSCNNVLLHRRLGHPSFNVLKHVPEVKSIDTTDIYSTKHVPVPSPPSYHPDSDDDTSPDAFPHFTPDPVTTTPIDHGSPTTTDIISQPSHNNSNSSPVTVYVPPPRRSQRIPKKPLWLDDYVCKCVSHSDATCYPSTFTSTHMSFVALLSSVQEPRSYLEASKDARWVAAMNEELSALDKNELGSLFHYLQGRELSALNPDGSVQRYKARLVAKGYNQVEGIDYFDSFFPVAKSVTVCVFMAVAVAKGWPLWQLDVNNAFLHGHLDEEVYLVPPQGYFPAVSGHVCKLKRSLYDLKQASRQWNIELTTKLHEFGYIQCPHDHCLFLKSRATYTLFSLFKDLGSAKYFLGLELARSAHGPAHGLLVTQQKYLIDILRDVNLLDAKVTSTPLPPGLHLTADNGSILPDPGPYRRLVGRLLYLGFTRPDISFAVQQLSQFIQHPRSSHWDAAVHVLRYLKGTSALGLFFLPPTHFSLLFLLMRLGPPARTLAVQPQVSVSSWAPLSYLGKQRNSQRFLVPLLKLNIVVWELRCVNSYGFPTCFVPFAFPSPHLFRFGVITMLPSILLPIPYFTSAPNTWTSTVTLSAINSNWVSSSHFSSLAAIS
ncbi:UNVERIFIED_CONTAM: Retrovirus-related Pol polyprotein from transposon RE2 [Sesamum latifolium]|uniref:Retrovirus-related Pol polyprotein from transposon RE2 n=1 Tax=Sesamum latifolium TaxID=2727402 RepID=A0AAW2VX48_9LAMI